MIEDDATARALFNALFRGETFCEVHLGGQPYRVRMSTSRLLDPSLGHASVGRVFLCNEPIEDALLALPLELRWSVDTKEKGRKYYDEASSMELMRGFYSDQAKPAPVVVRDPTQADREYVPVVSTHSQLFDACFFVCLVVRAPRMLTHH